MKFHRIAALFLSLVLAFSLAACGQGASSASSASFFALLRQKAKPMSSCWPRKTRSFLQTMLCGESVRFHGQKHD